VPDQSEHETVDALLDLSQIGMSISDGYAPVPEQSTLALVAHHPQAFYFGMKQGKLKPADKTAPDDVIKGSKRDPSLFAQADAEELDTDPVDGGVAEGEGEGDAQDTRVAAEA
jgi:5-methyltetrahydrofolate--homocysteine methyltransferase